jgi:hypothetical protein
VPTTAGVTIELALRRPRACWKSAAIAFVWAETAAGDLVLEGDHILAELSRQVGVQLAQRPVDVVREVVCVFREEEHADAVAVPVPVLSRCRHVVQSLDADDDSSVGDGCAGQRRERVVAAGGGARAGVPPEECAGQHHSGEGARDNETRDGGAEPGAGPLLVEVAAALGYGPEGEAHREYEEKDNDYHRGHTGRRRRADVQQHYGVVSVHRSSSHGPGAHQPSM